MSVIVIGNFFFLNLSIGVIIAKYNREKELFAKDLLLTEEQKKWVKFRMNILQSQPNFIMRAPFSFWRQPFYYISESPYVQGFSFMCIVCNTLVLALEWYGQSKAISISFENVNFIFAVIFTLEIIMKIIGYGLRFFKDPWNNFDITIVFITLIGIILNTTNNNEIGPQTTIIRSFRIARIFYFFKKNKALRATLMTFMVSLPALVNIGTLLILVNVIYSILGVYLFGDIKLNTELNEHANF